VALLAHGADNNTTSGPAFKALFPNGLDALPYLGQQPRPRHLAGSLSFTPGNALRLLEVSDWGQPQQRWNPPSAGACENRRKAGSCG
jgi:hypothetical protein